MVVFEFFFDVPHLRETRAQLQAILVSIGVSVFLNSTSSFLHDHFLWMRRLWRRDNLDLVFSWRQIMVLEPIDGLEYALKLQFVEAPESLVFR